MGKTGENMPKDNIERTGATFPMIFTDTAPKPPQCDHQAGRRWEWREDPAMPGAQVLTEICEVCGAAMPPRLPQTGAGALVHVRPRDGAEDANNVR